MIKTITDAGEGWSGDWKNAENKFVGVRFYLKGQGYYYGWIRISFDETSEQFIMHDYAFMTTAGIKIAAGQDALIQTL